MRITTRSAYAGGWTLVEMSVVLVVCALLATAAINLLPLGTQLAEEDLARTRLAQAEQALLGHARAHHRLPNADINGDGREDSGGKEGRLPYATLGLPASAAAAYSVNSSLTGEIDGYLFNPSLPITTKAAAATAMPVNRNGLDLCVKLSNLQHIANGAGGSGSASAFALAHRRPSDAIAADAPAPIPPEGGVLPNASQLDTATGMGELYVRLECTSRLNKAYAAAQAARAAQSAYLLAELDADTAAFYIDVADLEDEFNSVSIGFSSFNIATAVFELALATAGALADAIPPTDIPKAIVAVAQAVAAGVQLGLAGLELDLARQSKAESEATLRATRNHSEHAELQLTRMRQLRDNATEKAMKLDLNGLNP